MTAIKKLTNSEIISKEYQRRELLQLLYKKAITREQLDGLHILDTELSGIDIVGILLDELKDAKDLYEANHG